MTLERNFDFLRIISLSEESLTSFYLPFSLVHAILSGDAPNFESSIWTQFADIQAWWGRLHASDQFLKMLDAHSQMAVLGHLSKTGGETSSVEDRLFSIESMLLTPAACCKTEWEKFCDFYAISGSIYFHRVLRQRPIEDDVVQLITRRGVKLLFQEVLPGMMSHCVVLPMLVIGSHCITDHDRRIVREALSPSLSYLSFGNMPVMADFLRALWKRNDMQATWWDMFHDVCMIWALLLDTRDFADFSSSTRSLIKSSCSSDVIARAISEI